MPDLAAFLAAAEAESKMPSVSVGLASGMIPPQLRELMRQPEGEPGGAPPLPPGQYALAHRLVTLFRTLPPDRAAEFENSVGEFIDKWLSQHKTSA
jgi:hypothetical protein